MIAHGPAVEVVSGVMDQLGAVVAAVVPPALALAGVALAVLHGWRFVRSFVTAEASGGPAMTWIDLSERHNPDNWDDDDPRWDRPRPRAQWDTK